MRVAGRRSRLPLAAAAALALIATVVTGGEASSLAAAHRVHVCRGALTGTIHADVVVKGTCLVDAGDATVYGSVTVTKGSEIAADFAHNDRTHSGTSNLTVKGSVLLGPGATAFLGCKASSSPCTDDSQSNPTLNNKIVIGGDIVSTRALGVIVHSTTVRGSVSWTGGGGGLKCVPVGVFIPRKIPAFYDIEDSSIDGSLTVKDITGCWLGVIRDHIGSNFTLTGDKMADPDAMEIGFNHIGGNISCSHDTTVWDSAENPSNPGGAIYPRILQLNTVSGKRSGQCVRSSATAQGGPSGQYPF